MATHGFDTPEQAAMAEWDGCPEAQAHVLRIERCSDPDLSRFGNTVRAVARAGSGSSSEKARREEARATVAAYHQEQLRGLLEHVRDGFDRLDSGDLDAFELDDLIHHYKQATKRLWVFCEAGGGNWTSTAAALADMRARGVERDWWAETGGRGRRS